MANLNPVLSDSGSQGISLTESEQRTLRDILACISSQENSRYKQLRKKLHAETLTDPEHQELIALSDKREEVQVKRLEYLAEIAKKRNLTLREFMDALNLKPSSYV